MPPTANKEAQRTKLANSYKELLDEFSSKDLRTVGNYTLGKLIGKGSFGKVYLASHKLTNGSKVVLKSAKKDDPNLAREIHHHRQFLHPHIARLYEVIVTENLVWLVLEYCPGDELYNHLLKTGPLEPAKVQRIFTQLVGAVTYVHRKGCVHRDLKLENILLDKHGNVKLVDFGFTREYEGKTNYLQTWCGTVCYSAPEMLKGEKYAGEKVDIWSLGIILYALLCGELPFDLDDENETRLRILKEEPLYPDHIPPQAKDLIKLLLSKRPLLRPSFQDILSHPWLTEYAPQQQAILKLQQPEPFSTPLEKDTLERMKAAGVNIDMVIENVLAQRCDSLAGWWALMIEKEERKARRRERKRKERDAESKSIRRLSAASSRLERMAPTIRETDEEGVLLIGEPPKGRGRTAKRSAATAAVPDLPRLPEQVSPGPSESPPPPPPIEKDSVRSASSSRPRPPLPPKEYRMSTRSSRLHIVSTNPELLTPNGFVSNRRRKYQAPFINHLLNLKHWIKESAKRAKSPGSKGSSKNSPNTKSSQSEYNKPDLRRGSTSGAVLDRNSIPRRPDLSTRSTYPARPRITTTTSTGSIRHRPSPSLSPSPLTPRSSFRRSTHGLRSRKSSSVSSVSSVRSFHHQHTHSKASSTSSASASVISPAPSTITNHKMRSPHNSVKVLPATPTMQTFPSGIRVVRGPLNESAAAFGAMPLSPGLPVFARRKRSPFKGPMLGVSGPSSHGSRSQANSRSGSVQGRRSGEIIEEEDEDEIEEVDAFQPTGPGEFIEDEEPLPAIDKKWLLETELAENPIS